MIFHRLEHVCYTVEHGEWPFQRRPSSYIPPPPYDSRSGTPVGSSTPRPESSLADSEPGDTMEVNQVMRQINETDKDFEVHLSEVGRLYLFFIFLLEFQLACLLPMLMSCCTIIAYHFWNWMSSLKCQNSDTVLSLLKSDCFFLNLFFLYLCFFNSFFFSCCLKYIVFSLFY